MNFTCRSPKTNDICIGEQLFLELRKAQANSILALTEREKQQNENFEKRLKRLNENNEE